MDDALHILIVEDSPTDRKLVEVYLAKSDLACELAHAEDLSETLAHLQSQPTDVILMDLHLPGSFGLQTFLDVHRLYPNIPVVILSGNSDNETVVGAVREGAQDYLPKSEFSSSTLSRSIRYAVERHERNVLRRQLADHEEDLQSAASVQRRLLPDRPPELPGFDIAGICNPASAAGGDLFDYLKLSHSRWGFVVADVSSHGLGPALIMASTRRVLRSLRQYHFEPGALLTAANTDLCEDTGLQHFVTAMLAVIDPENRTLHYASAGHTSEIMNLDGSFTKFETGGLPMGVVEDNPIPTSDAIPLQPGQILVLLTDGLAEAMNSSNELFGIGRIQELVRRHKDEDAQVMVDRLVTAVQTHCSPKKHSDDLTAVIVKVL